MTHRPTSSHTTAARTLLALAAAASLALGLGTGCMDTGEDDGEFQGLEIVKCPSPLVAWAPNLPYEIGDIRSFKGEGKSAPEVFKAIQKEFIASADWFPDKVPALWTKVQCGNGLPPVTSPPATPPPATPPPATPPPANNPPPPTPVDNSQSAKDKTLQLQCLTNFPLLKFDVNGEDEAEDGIAGNQFIPGRCKRNSDCASGCCAQACGICSGPGAATQNGKNGCGFTIEALRANPIPRKNP
jgi:hypothetical protein